MSTETVGDKEFAGQYQRDEDGRILFPRDQAARSELFVKEVNLHPAKANLWMLEEIVKYVSEPGETVMDIMSGTGSLMIAALMGRNVVCIELEPVFMKIQLDSREKILSYDGELFRYGSSVGSITNLFGDCREYLPLPVDHIIFSPPYSSVLDRRHKAKSSRELAGAAVEGYEIYSTDRPENLGALNDFKYTLEMEKIYKLCLQSVRPGGTMTVIIQDIMRQGKRKELSEAAWRSCIKAGWQHEGWYKRWQQGTAFKAIWRSKGFEVVDDEDIIIFRRAK
jgi:DNA modification methylase